MKILFIGSTHRNSTARYYMTSLKQLGYDVLTFSPNFFQPQGYFDALCLKITKQPAHTVRQSIAKKVAGLCKEHQFSLVFVMGENFFDAESIDLVKKAISPAPRFLFHSHDNLFSKGVLTPKNLGQMLCSYDFVFTTKSQNVARYQSLGVEEAFFLPSAFEPSIHHPVSQAHTRFGSKRFPISFVGTYDRSRDKFLNSIGWENLHVWGDRWERAPQFETHKSRIEAKAIYGTDYADILSHSDCSLGLLREEAEDKHTQRTFEIPACGALQFTPRNEEILSFFEEDKEIICFETPQELKEKVTYYLSHPKERERIAKGGYERCLKGGHSYLDRTKEILSKL